MLAARRRLKLRGRGYSEQYSNNSSMLVFVKSGTQPAYQRAQESSAND